MLIKRRKALYWTAHSRAKMNFYRLSESRVKRVINSPERIEVGIAPNTIAMMQSVKNSKHTYEIWVMIQEAKTKRRVISAWKYPGKTRPGDPIPEEVLRELNGILYIIIKTYFL